jgi:endonuclease YncB( thermonuclease family)
MGFDAPETFQAKCPEERELGMRAKARMQELIEAGDWNLYRVKNRDRYGRDLAVMKVKGRDVAEIMISEGLAREYHGKGKRRGWCGEDIRP